MGLFEEIVEAMVEGEQERTLDLVKRCLDEGTEISRIVDEGLAVGIRKVGDLWEEGEFFLPELMQGAEIMKAAMDHLHPLILEQGGTTSGLGRVVIGTVEGDIHDIGKTLVGAMLTANGFEVFDLGADVPVSRFVSEAEEKGASLICLSALLTTTLDVQKEVVDELKARGVRDRYIVMVGGAPATEAWKEEIGADGYAENAVTAVEVARRLVSAKGSD